MDFQCITPAVTILDPKGRLDREENHKLYAHLLSGGVSGFVVLGSSGEFFSLGMDQTRELMGIAADFDRGSMRVFAGASRMDPDESVALANHACDLGLHGVMIVSPYYFSLNDDCVFEYYSYVAKRTEAKIILYNFPARTGYSLSTGLLLRLADKHDNIVGIKDTVMDMWHTADIIREVKSRFPHFEVFSGYDNNLAHNVLSGGNGCIGSLSNLVPEVFADWLEALRREDFRAIARCQRKVDGLMRVYGIADIFIPVIKKGLVLRGVVASSACTRPFPSADAAQTRRLEELLAEMGVGKSAVAGA
ncbi:MAG: dihydrodipicolinate synthase family protein [Desulfovibrio sp.]|jgi:4-hydroxy-tetrahydrodipicolinate synthase|nr:dihydrodipicolinate synthase family protein [Desulfovibrio sp.]